MALFASLSALALRPLLAAVTRAVGQTVGDPAADAAADYLLARLSDPSRKLLDALARANERAWRALEVALAGESLWTWLDRGEEKALRQQVRLFLDAVPLGTEGTGFSARALAQLRSARKTGLLASGRPEDIAKQAVAFVRFADPVRLLEVEWTTVEGMAGVLQRVGHAELATLLNAHSPGQPPLLGLAVRFFFRREVETDAELFQGLAFEQLDQLGQALSDGLNGVSLLLERQTQQLDELLEKLAGLHSDVFDLKAEQARQGEAVRDIYEVVSRIGNRLERLHERALRPGDSLSVRGDEEQSLVQEVIRRYRALPEQQRAQLPALLLNIGKLEVAVGEYRQAQDDFRTVASLIEQSTAQAEAQAGAYQAALEQRDWPAAQEALLAAARLDPERFAPFPPAKYEPERILGAGGFGVAWLCRDRDSGGRVVVKTLHGEALERGVGDVFREAAALETLEHPAIIRLRHCDYADRGRTRPFLVMDYFDGVTLAEYVRQHGSLSVADAVGVAGHMAEALATAHGRGVLHRDVKPANLLMRREGDGWRVKLIDFGLALQRRVVEQTASHADALSATVAGSSVAGTLDYAAPEQVGKLPGVKPGAAADVYSFSKTVCFALFGTPTPRRDHWKRVPEALADLLDTGLAEQPAERPSFESVREGLRTVCDKVPAPIAEPQLVNLRRTEAEAWASTVKANDLRAYENFLREWPEGSKANEAWERFAGFCREALLKDLTSQDLRKRYLSTRTPWLREIDSQGDPVNHEIKALGAGLYTGFCSAVCALLGACIVVSGINEGIFRVLGEEAARYFSYFMASLIVIPALVVGGVFGLRAYSLALSKAANRKDSIAAELGPLPPDTPRNLAAARRYLLGEEQAQEASDPERR
jgi:serine/threonine protein kinase